MAKVLDWQTESSYPLELYELYPLWVPVTEKPSPQSLIDGFVVHYNSIIPEGTTSYLPPISFLLCLLPPAPFPILDKHRGGGGW